MGNGSGDLQNQQVMETRRRCHPKHLTHWLTGYIGRYYSLVEDRQHISSTENESEFLVVRSSSSSKDDGANELNFHLSFIIDKEFFFIGCDGDHDRLCVDLTGGRRPTPRLVNSADPLYFLRGRSSSLSKDGGANELSFIPSFKDKEFFFVGCNVDHDHLCVDLTGGRRPTPSLVNIADLLLVVRSTNQQLISHYECSTDGQRDYWRSIVSRMGKDGRLRPDPHKRQKQKEQHNGGAAGWGGQGGGSGDDGKQPSKKDNKPAVGFEHCECCILPPHAVASCGHKFCRAHRCMRCVFYTQAAVVQHMLSNQPRPQNHHVCYQCPLCRTNQRWRFYNELLGYSSKQPRPNN